jgi:hypothetical protein
MADLRKINPSDFKNNPDSAANVINRIIDEMQRLALQEDSVIKEVVMKHGVSITVSASELRNKLKNVEVLDYLPVRLLPVTDDLQDYEVINHSIQIDNAQSAKCRFFWNNPDTYDQLKIRLRFSS